MVRNPEKYEIVKVAITKTDLYPFQAHKIKKSLNNCKNMKFVKAIITAA